MSRCIRFIKRFLRSKDAIGRRNRQTDEIVDMDFTTGRKAISGGVFVDPICSAYANPPIVAEFIDHYAVLNLELGATTEEIKTAYRNLYVQYFNSDVKMYKSLITAYTVLVDQQARYDYDVVYRLHFALPPPPPPVDEGKATQTQFLSPLESFFNSTSAVASPVSSAPSGPFDNDVDGDCTSASEMPEVYPQDSNSVPKHYQPDHEPVLVKRPSSSRVPILKAHIGRGVYPKLRCARPKHTGVTAEFEYSPGDNRALKHYQLAGRLYSSRIPILKAYNGRKGYLRMRCAHPTHTGVAAKFEYSPSDNWALKHYQPNCELLLRNRLCASPDPF